MSRSTALILCTEACSRLEVGLGNGQLLPQPERISDPIPIANHLAESKIPSTSGAGCLSGDEVKAARQPKPPRLGDADAAGLHIIAPVAL